MSLDDRIKQLTETILEQVRLPVETGLQRVLDDVIKLAVEERDRSLAELREQLDRERETAVQAARDEAAARHQSALEEQETRIRADHESAVQAARDEAAARHQSALEEQETRLRADHESAVQFVRDELGRDHEQALDQARAETADARQAAAHAELALGSAHAADREHEMACTEGMLIAFRQFDTARSLTEVLGALADRAAEAAGRAAIFVVANSRLRGWVLRGLGDVDPASIDVPIEPDTVFGVAAARGEAISTAETPIGADGDALSTLLSAPGGRAGLAVPISVGGRTVAILYADDAGEPAPVVPSSWPEQVEIMTRHAGRCLEVLTLSREA